MRRTGACGPVWGAVALLLLAGCVEPPEEASPRAPDVPERVVLVTGSTDGLGREVALALATPGTLVLVHGRNEDRGSDVVREIRSREGADARFYRADFASLDEVRALARNLLHDHDRLDLLVNNAGIGPGAPGHDRGVTEDGHELRFQVNYLAGYLLTRELLPLLRVGAPSRIVNVTSRNQQALDFEDLRLDEGYSGGLAYGRSKLAQILHIVDLATELEADGISAFAVHPAPAMDTGLVRETGSTPQSPVSLGVASVMRVVTATDLPTGAYFHEQEQVRAHEQAYDPDARRLLREASERFVGSGR